MVESEKKPVLLSGIQPSGSLTIGHLLGAIRNWTALQDRYDCLFPVVDLHAITVPQEAAKLRQRTMEVLCCYIACGIDPERSTIFVQSHVPAHSELAWLLGCQTFMGELNRMTQFKDKSKKQGANIPAGLFFYPVLMAADILLYDTNLVPVGEDQKQHLELTRDLAQRFNHRFGETFRVPEPFIPKVGARIMSLTDPAAKMSKSDENPKSWIALLDPPDAIRSKVRKAVTDSGAEIRFDPAIRPAISNLLAIWSGLTGEAIPALESRYAGKGYGDFKQDMAEAVVAALSPIRERYEAIRGDEARLNSILAAGAGRAAARAARVLSKVRRRIGFLDRPGAV